MHSTCVFKRFCHLAGQIKEIVSFVVAIYFARGNNLYANNFILNLEDIKLKFRLILCVLVILILISVIPVYAIDNTESIAEHVFTNAELAGSTTIDTSNMLMPSTGFIPINLIEDQDSRASTTYYIAEMNEGYLLTSPTSGTLSKTRYSAGNSNSHSLQKWIFTEDSDGNYIVYSNTDTSKCLTVNPVTRDVTLSTYSGSQFQKWKMYYSSNGNALQCVSTNANVDGYKLVINSTSCSVSNTIFTPMGFLNVSWFVPCTAIEGRDMAVAVGSNYSMYEPIFTPSDSTCNSDNWLSYTSWNTSICTINTSGKVFGISSGTTRITIVHKITRANTSFIVRVLTPLTYNARVYYDSSSTLSASTISAVYNSAVNDIYRTYCIDFVLSSTLQSFVLNGHSCPNSTESEICTTSCGADSTCSSAHHKSASRLLNQLSSSSYYTYRLVSHPVCFYDAKKGVHSEVVGLGHRPGQNAITSMENTPNLTRSIQHELTHNLGGSHETCIPSQKCVLNGDYGYWCDNCQAAILDQRG